MNQGVQAGRFKKLEKATKQISPGASRRNIALLDSFQKYGLQNCKITNVYYSKPLRLSYFVTATEKKNRERWGYS